ncbi:hypothetical protein AMPC_22630 [Anaeromyxobacter paludicola]|uniref:Uncharacterized protein n=2 Tax=Anaeromyxobacter paludicola TaxID=2918171 RepID=A0ABN6NAX5_9BACT|nr:hypothetical protein AMPC_22630 [Anaeromyxobacter paludicola]
MEGSGRFALVELAVGADVERCCHAALDLLGHGARLLSVEEAEVQRAARRRGERWYRADDALELSLLEGRIMSARISAAVASPLGLDRADAERLADEIRAVVWDFLEAVHRGELPAGRFFEAWPGLAEVVARRCAAFAPGRHEPLRAALVAQFARRS